MMRRNPESKRPIVVPSTRPFFECGLCPYDVWREGGIASALKHSKAEHVGQEPSYTVESKKSVMNKFSVTTTYSNDKFTRQG